jgi:hypothetical protein
VELARLEVERIEQEAKDALTAKVTEEQKESQSRVRAVTDAFTSKAMLH